MLEQIVASWWFILLVAIWTAPWKGIALWKAARRKHIVWFIVLLVVNTLAILEILYIFVFSKCCEKGKNKGKKKEQKKKKR